MQSAAFVVFIFLSECRSLFVLSSFFRPVLFLFISSSLCFSSLTEYHLIRTLCRCASDAAALWVGRLIVFLCECQSFFEYNPASCILLNFDEGETMAAAAATSPASSSLSGAGGGAGVSSNCANISSGVADRGSLALAAAFPASAQHHQQQLMDWCLLLCALR